MERSFSLDLSTEKIYFFLKQITQPDFKGIDQQVVSAFRKSLHLQSVPQVVEALSAALCQAGGLELSRLLFLTFLALNWIPIKSFPEIRRLLSQNPVLTTEATADRFNTLQDSYLFYFNKTFILYITDYLASLELAFALKHVTVSPEAYVEGILAGEIGFEGILLMLENFRPSFALLDHLWPCAHAFGSELECLFKFLIEIVTSRIFEEYLFIKKVLKAAVTVYDRLVASKSFECFLCVFCEFSWKNRKLISIYESQTAYFKENLIRFPALYSFEPHIAKHLNLMAAEKSAQVLNIKAQIKRLNADLRGQLAVDYIEKTAQLALHRNGKAAIFDKKDILGFLDLLKISSKTFKKPRGISTV